jgi:ribosomal protein L7/L12
LTWCSKRRGRSKDPGHQGRARADHLGLREAKEVVDGAPSDVLKAVPKEQADAAKEKLEAVGASVTIR